MNGRTRKRMLMATVISKALYGVESWLLERVDVKKLLNQLSTYKKIAIWYGLNNLAFNHELTRKDIDVYSMALKRKK